MTLDSIRFVDSRCVLAVRDLEKSTRFYTDVLGFQHDPITAQGWSFLSKDTFKVMLGECSDEVPAMETGNHSWYAHVIIEGVDAYFEEVSSRGAETLSRPANREYGLREFVLRTPDGHRLMFGERIER